MSFEGEETKCSVHGYMSDEMGIIEPSRIESDSGSWAGRK